MFALIQIENHASNKGKTAGRYQFDTHLIRIGLIDVNASVRHFVLFTNYVYQQYDWHGTNSYRISNICTYLYSYCGGDDGRIRRLKCQNNLIIVLQYHKILYCIPKLFKL